MLIQEKINTPDTLLKLYVAIDEDLKALQPQLQRKHLPRDPRGGTPVLSAAEVLTILVWGAWRALTERPPGFETVPPRDRLKRGRIRLALQQYTPARALDRSPDNLRSP